MAFETNMSFLRIGRNVGIVNQTEEAAERRPADGGCQTGSHSVSDIAGACACFGSERDLRQEAIIATHAMSGQGGGARAYVRTALT